MYEQKIKIKTLSNNKINQKITDPVTTSEISLPTNKKCEQFGKVDEEKNNNKNNFQNSLNQSSEANECNNKKNLENLIFLDSTQEYSNKRTSNNFSNGKSDEKKNTGKENSCKIRKQPQQKSKASHKVHDNKIEEQEWHDNLQSISPVIDCIDEIQNINRGEYLKTSQKYNTQSEHRIDENFNYNSKTRRTNSLEEFERFEKILNKELDSTYHRILQKTRKNSRSEFHAENSLNHNNNGLNYQTNFESKSKIKINPLQNLSKHTSNSIQSRVNLLLKKSNQLEQYQRSVLHRSDKAHEDIGSITKSDNDSCKPFMKEGDNCPSSKTNKILIQKFTTTNSFSSDSWKTEQYQTNKNHNILKKPEHSNSKEISHHCILSRNNQNIKKIRRRQRPTQLIREHNNKNTKSFLSATSSNNTKNNCNPQKQNLSNFKSITFEGNQSSNYIESTQKIVKSKSKQNRPTQNTSIKKLSGSTIKINSNTENIQQHNKQELDKQGSIRMQRKESTRDIMNENKINLLVLVGFEGCRLFFDFILAEP